MAESTANLLDAAVYGLMTAIDGSVLLAAGEYEASRALIQGARSMLERIGFKVTLPDLWRIEAETLLALGRQDEAIVMLRQAAEEARSMNARRQLWPILGVLARLADAREAGEAAAVLRREARDIIELMAGDLDEDMRRNFFAMPEVREAGGFH
jgi:tetratricopeptide (TPR) repeat protein